MRIPKYWANDEQTVSDESGERASFSCWRWSDNSVAEAKEWARISAREIAWRLLRREHLDRYGYGERPMREEIVRPIADSEGAEIAVITRNAYGALVLNVARVMFMDIDFPMIKPRSLWQKWFGRQPRAEVQTPEVQTLQSVEQWAANHPQLGLRIYRTFAGLRCLVTNTTFEPADSATLALLQSVKCDPLYVTLCRQQACFRARLTPKPWRCRLPLPPSRFPWDSRELEERYRQWENLYQRGAESYAVCRLIKQLGPTETHPEVATVLALHDQYTCKVGNMQLA
jgi:hypothetical protein